MTEKVNTVAIVGERLSASMFDVRGVFGGQLDPTQLVIGPIANYTYRGGTCGLSVTPDRIDLRQTVAEVAPSLLHEAAVTVLRALDEIRGPVMVSAIGFNCDVVVPYDTPLRGIAVCREYVAMNKLTHIVGIEEQNVSLQTKYMVDAGPLVYTLRLAPDDESQGKNLYLAINGHQQTRVGDLSGCLEHYDSFRTHVREIHGQFGV